MMKLKNVVTAVSLFSKESFMAFIEYCSGFLQKKLVNPNTIARIQLLLQIVLLRAFWKNSRVQISFQIEQENLCDYLLIIYVTKLLKRSGVYTGKTRHNKKIFWTLNFAHNKDLIGSYQTPLFCFCARVFTKTCTALGQTKSSSFMYFCKVGNKKMG